MNIQEVEKLTGITKQNIRFYEKQGLISPNRNGVNGYREYGEKELHDIKIIKLLRKLDMSLSEIQKVLMEEEDLDDAVFRQQTKLEAARSDLDAAIRSCKKISEYSLASLDVDKELLAMEEEERRGGKFAELLDDFRLAALLERKWTLRICPQSKVKKKEDFTRELIRYADENQMTLVMIEEGMQPEFLLDGVKCKAKLRLGGIFCQAMESHAWSDAYEEFACDKADAEYEGDALKKRKRVKKMRLLYRVLSAVISMLIIQGLLCIFLGMSRDGIVTMIFGDLVIILVTNIIWWRLLK